MLLVLGNHQESRESPSHRGICTEKRGEFWGRSLFGKFSPVLRVELRASRRQESGWQFPPKFEVGSWGLTFGSFSALWNQSFPERVSQGSASSYPVFSFHLVKDVQPTGEAVLASGEKCLDLRKVGRKVWALVGPVSSVAEVLNGDTQQL